QFGAALTQGRAGLSADRLQDGVKGCVRAKIDDHRLLGPNRFHVLLQERGVQTRASDDGFDLHPVSLAAERGYDGRNSRRDVARLAERDAGELAKRIVETACKPNACTPLQRERPNANQFTLAPHGSDEKLVALRRPVQADAGDMVVPREGLKEAR